MVNKASAVADGQDSIILTAVIRDAAGTVIWAASSPAVSISGNVMTVKSNPAGVILTGTDADGQTVPPEHGQQLVCAECDGKWFSCH
ncbi:hypothetical protein RCM87_00895 [Escherichia marmotae]|nr:Ig-like domain-containing protein [Escherichia coli]MEC9799144.1 hypothetical protein [Escherichia marmotae]MED9300299.1 hypothetical protein [Escherichia marmotae]MED9382949.1 hypothetical protein [Escherichia marmotae]